MQSERLLADVTPLDDSWSRDSRKVAYLSFGSSRFDLTVRSVLNYLLTERRFVQAR